MRTGLGTILFSVALAALRAESPSETEIRNGAAKALTLIQATQKVWASKQSCVSCHHQVLPLLATVVANEHGIPFDIEAARTNAAAVGQATTSAVVTGITWIIASDGLFAVICSALHI